MLTKIDTARRMATRSLSLPLSVAAAVAHTVMLIVAIAATGGRCCWNNQILFFLFCQLFFAFSDNFGLLSL